MWKKLKYWNRQKNRKLRQLKLSIVDKMFNLVYRPTPLDVKTVRKVLVLRDDNKIGDMIVSTGLFDCLHHSGIRVDVVAGKDNAFIAETMPQVSKVYFFPKKIIDILRMALALRRNHYDMVLDFGDYLSPVYYSFISTINARYTLGFNKSLYSRYDINVETNEKDLHVTSRYEYVSTLLNAASSTYHYALNVPKKTRQEMVSFLQALDNKPLVILNPFSAAKDRTLSQYQISSISEEIHKAKPDATIVIIGPPNELSKIPLPKNTIKNPYSTFWSAVILVENASLLISPDTSWVHVACAYKTPLIALYKSKIIDGGLINEKVWAPNFQPSTQIITHKENISDITVQEISIVIKDYLGRSSYKRNIP